MVGAYMAMPRTAAVAVGHFRGRDQQQTPRKYHITAGADVHGPRHGAATRGTTRAGAQLWRHGRQSRRSRAAARGRGRGWRGVRRLLSKIQQIYNDSLITKLL